MNSNAMIDSLQAMLARGRDDALVRYGLGAEYLKLGNHDNAIEHLRRALELDGNYSAAWKLLGQALAQAGDNAGAIHTYQQGIDIARNKGDVQTAKEMTVFLRRLQGQTSSHE